MVALVLPTAAIKARTDKKASFLRSPQLVVVVVVADRMARVQAEDRAAAAIVVLPVALELLAAITAATGTTSLITAVAVAVVRALSVLTERQLVAARAVLV